MYIDFQTLKEQVSIEMVAGMLNIDISHCTDTWRGPCPKCNDGGKRSLAIAPGKGFYCFSAKKGGDCIALASHLLGVSVKEAAMRIADHFKPKTEETVSAPGEEPSVLNPLAYLHFEHAAVQALGIEKDIAEKLGIGYAKKGIMRGRVAIPLRTDDGTLVGYCGFSADADPLLKFPKTINLPE